MTHARFVAQFTRGRHSVRIPNRHVQGIDRHTATAYLSTAFEQWLPVSSVVGGVVRLEFEPYRLDSELIAQDKIDCLCDAMFGARSDTDAPNLLYCRPSPGLDPRDFYTRARAQGRSLVVVSPKEPVVTQDVGESLLSWESLLESLIGDCEDAANSVLHVWVIKEPTVSKATSSLKALASIALLEMHFKLEDAVDRVAGNARNKFWERLNESAVVVVKRNLDNEHARQLAADTSPRTPSAGNSGYRIVEGDVFSWSGDVQLEGVRPSLQLSVVGVGVRTAETLPQYAILDGITPPKGGQIYVVSEVPGPGVEVDKSFINLVAASRQYLNASVPTPHLDDAKRMGWKFYRPREFINVPFPLDQTP